MDLMRQELKVCGQLDHPHIVRTLNLMEDDTNIYIVMEYIPGQHLLSLLSDEDAELTEREIGNYIHQIMLALNYMHAVGVIHRDLKLENIMIH